MTTTGEVPSRQVAGFPGDLTFADDAVLDLILLLMTDSGCWKPRQAGAAESVRDYLVAVAASCPKRTRTVARRFEGGSWSGGDADESLADIDQAPAGRGCDAAPGRTLVYQIRRSLDWTPVEQSRNHILGAGDSLLALK